ncbi:MAG TPA: methylmalonyl-CoA mutase family protein, partial [Puia sp.]|nr:methylmalonyl-CoA mutase family protein [Puia sp.]
MGPVPENKIRIVTAASLFDGHDAAINIMRRIMQAKGAEIIHLGHNRSVHEIVEAAIEEDVNGIAITSYQGGHLEYFKFMKDLLNENGGGHIKIFGGGGGTILPREAEELQHYGITRIYSPDDGRRMGLEGMIDDVLRLCKQTGASQNSPAPTNGSNAHFALGEWKDILSISRAISRAEANLDYSDLILPALGKRKAVHPVPVLGITGTGGAGKSSVTDEIVRRFLNAYADKTIAVISVDPSKKKTGGALLGDRIRMNSISSPRAYMRSLATRESDRSLSAHAQDAIDICKASGFDLILLESAGVGQSEASIPEYCDVSLYVMTPEYGAATQLEKINMLDYADVIAINKFDKAGSLDALSEVCKQYKRNHGLWTAKEEDLPVVGTIAAQFNDPGINELFLKLMLTVERKTGMAFGSLPEFREGRKSTERSTSTKSQIIPPSRVRYLSEISESIREYDELVKNQASIASKLYQLEGALQTIREQLAPSSPNQAELEKALEQSILVLGEQLNPVSRKLIQKWPEKLKAYQADFYQYRIRDKIIRQAMFTTSLSGTRIPKVVLPKYKDWGDILKWQAQENTPGSFPFTAGVFPVKREGEDPTRMFAGEGGPERTNKRFHYVSLDQPARRLSTAFDSVTLYGEDPAHR